MKRIHLFEFEDFAWFPNILRKCITRYINMIHKILGSSDELAELLKQALQHTSKPHILDMCSGSGGVMEEVYEKLRKEHHVKDLKMTLSDLYPNEEVAQKLNQQSDSNLSYHPDSLNATNLDKTLIGVRSMVCSMHHMKPEIAHQILKNAKEAHQPICIFEISDNSYPKWIWWSVLPINFLMVIFLTPLIRTMTWQQIVFTYIIPVLPFLIAWDGAVSNARTYTVDDLEILLKELKSDNYEWKTGVLQGKAKKLYLLGLPH